MGHPFFVIELKADFSLNDCVEFLNSVTENGKKIFRSLYVALPFFRLKEIIAAFPNSGITFGTSMINESSPGSFTEAISGEIIKDAGGQFTLIGTTYERDRLKISDDQLKYKINAAKHANVKPIYVVGKDNLVEQLEVLKETVIEETHPTIIYQLDYKKFENYLPNFTELTTAWETIQKSMEQVFSSESKKFAVLVSLPSDLIGFSSLIESIPFNGAFFTKSGTYPHSVRNETIKLLHVHCEDQQINP